MLRANKQSRATAGAAKVVIVASEYNAVYVDAMVKSARDELARAGAKGVEVIRVPGAFEIPVVATRLARSFQQAAGTGQQAIICLGVILRGETTHAAHIGEAVT